MSDAPERIWVQFERTGAIKRDNEPESKPVDSVIGSYSEYVRADLHDALARQRDEYESEGIELNRRLNNALNNLQEWQHRAEKAEAEVELLRNIMRSVLEVDQSVGTRSTVHDIAWSALQRKEGDK